MPYAMTLMLPQRNNLKALSHTNGARYLVKLKNIYRT